MENLMFISLISLFHVPTPPPPPSFFPLSGSLSLLLPLYLSQSLTFPASITFEEAQIFHRHTWGRIPSSWGDLHFKCNALCNVGNAFCINPIVEYIFGNLTVHRFPFPGICFQTEINCLLLYKFKMKSENYRGKYFQTTYLLIYCLRTWELSKIKAEIKFMGFSCEPDLTSTVDAVGWLCVKCPPGGSSSAFSTHLNGVQPSLPCNGVSLENIDQVGLPCWYNKPSSPRWLCWDDR